MKSTNTSSSLSRPLSHSQQWTAYAPSNIAFLKYWGKRDALKQWPANDSLSMTLSTAQTITTAERSDKPYDQFQWNGRSINSQEQDTHKVFQHLAMIRRELNLSTPVYLNISSRNTFPAECGIASSASGFAALTLAAVAAWTGHHQWDDLAILGVTRESLAHWSRRGSGSAGRSLFGGYVQWQAGASPDEQRLKPAFDAEHWDLSDVIVLVSSHEKPVSSSQAHLAAPASPLFGPRVAGTPEKLQRMLSALQNRDLEHLGSEIEAEAMEMHAVAMTGQPAVNYLLPETLQFLSWARMERQRGHLPTWFTIDAGPNVHMICETENLQNVQKRIAKEWPQFKTIADRVGRGPRIISGGDKNE